MKTILGIETSCDDSSAAIVTLDGVTRETRALSLKTFVQTDLHVPYGGVVPEISSRSHLETLPLMVEAALSEANLNAQSIDAIAVTTQPGLIGSLMVGVAYAKSLAYSLKKPLYSIHHLEGHVASLWINKKESDIPLPMLCLLVSGGHTLLLLIKDPPSKWTNSSFEEMCFGRSLDDAAGEAFDKIGKVLGFDYPAGPTIDKHSKSGNKAAYVFPKPLKGSQDYSFSFSGLKTAAKTKLDALKKQGPLNELLLQDFCASFQEAIIDALYSPFSRALVEFKPKAIGVVGGVSANSRLRERLNNESLPSYFPELKYCSDNAAMIATLGAYHDLGGLRNLSDSQALKLHAKAHL